MFVNQLSYKQAAKTMLDCALMDAPEGGEIAFVAASPTAPNHTAHIKYMNEYIANDPTYQVFKVVDTQYANDDDAKSYDVAINLMQAHPDLKVIISSSAVSAPAGARAISASGNAGKVFSTGFALPDAIKTYLKDGSQKCFALWNPYELGYLATYATHLKLAGKLDLTPGTTFEAGKAGSYTVGEGGEIVYGKPLMFTKENVDRRRLLIPCRGPPASPRAAAFHIARNPHVRPAPLHPDRDAPCPPREARRTRAAAGELRALARAPSPAASSIISTSATRTLRLLFLRELDRPGRARRASRPALPEGLVRPARRISRAAGRAALLQHAQRLRQVTPRTEGTR